MGRSVRPDGKLTIQYVEPTYATEEEQQAAIRKAKAAIMELAGLLGRMVAAEVIGEAKERANNVASETDDAKPGNLGRLHEIT
jgi:hypothetical protein